MKLRYLFLTFVSVCTVLSGCEKENTRPKIDYARTGDADTLSTNALIMNDTTKIQIANLPVSFDSTRVLLHISRLVNIEDIKRDHSNRYLSSYSKKNADYEKHFYASGVSGDMLSGWFTNIWFDDFANNEQRLLTNNFMFIRNITYLRKVSKIKGKDYLLYSVYDRDTNGDEEINTNDICSLYISNLDGTNFRKISNPNHEFIKGDFIECALRYYFITLEDVNKDGYFGKEDKYRYYYIDFSEENYSVVEYNPLNSALQQ